MSTNQAPNLRKRWPSIWRRVARPTVSRWAPDELCTVQLLSGLLLILLVAVILNVVVSATTSSIAPVMIIAVVVIAIALILSRTRFYAWAAAIALIMLAVLPFVRVLGDVEHSETAVRAHLVWVTLPILLSSLLLSIRATVAVAALSIGAMLLVSVLHPDLHFRSITGSLGIIITVSGLLVAFMWRRNQAELERQSALRQSEEKYRSLFESAPDSITLIGLDGTVLDCNNATTTVSGRSREEMVGQPFAELGVLDDRDLPRYVDLFGQLANGQKVGSVEVQVLRSDGKTHWLEVFPAFLQRNGVVQAIQVITRDITERKRADAERESLLNDLEDLVAERTAELVAVNEELEAFAYSVSHDLRAPLRSIDGFSQVLLEDHEDQLDEIGQDLLRRVRVAGQRMGQLIDDLLRLSRLTRRELQSQVVDLSALARATAASLRDTDPQHRIELVVAPGIIANGDQQLLQIVLENLLSNAWKFTANHLRARIEFGVTEHSGERAYFVRDDGAGFDMAYADKLFGAFQRLHGVKEFEGSGIGLATVRRIVHRHGGRVWAEGAVEQGATFYFTLGASGGSAE